MTDWVIPGMRIHITIILNFNIRQLYFLVEIMFLHVLVNYISFDGVLLKKKHIIFSLF